MNIHCSSCDNDTDEAGTIYFLTWHDFFRHVNVAHPTEKEYINTIPFNISGRNKRQIVQMAEEQWLKDYII